MNEQDQHYYAVHRSGNNDELKHWKYIKKIKGPNGKWRYFYDTTELTKYRDENRVGTYDKDGTKTTTTYKDTNNLLSSRTTYSNDASMYANGKTYRFKSKKVVNERGKIDRAIDNTQAKAEKYIYNKFYKNRKSGSLRKTSKKTINKGKRAIDKLLRSIRRK